MTPNDALRHELTAERRREVCIHEAAHAVIHALGGAFVYDVEVAPVGAVEWRTTGRKGGLLSDLWGVCRLSDPEGVFGLVRWNEADGGYECDRAGYKERLQLIAANVPSSGRIATEARRRLRAWICGAIAGPMADAIHAGEKPGEIWLEPEYMPGEDLTVAEALAWFLPYRMEYGFLLGVTEKALREPELWGQVMTLANDLEKAGCLGCDDESMDTLQGLLPEPRRNWPPTPRTAFTQPRAEVEPAGPIPGADFWRIDNE